MISTVNNSIIDDNYSSYMYTENSMVKRLLPIVHACISNRGACMHENISTAVPVKLKLAWYGGLTLHAHAAHVLASIPIVL